MRLKKPASSNRVPRTPSKLRLVSVLRICQKEETMGLHFNAKKRLSEDLMDFEPQTLQVGLGSRYGQWEWRNKKGFLTKREREETLRSVHQASPMERNRYSYHQSPQKIMQIRCFLLERITENWQLVTTLLKTRTICLKYFTQLQKWQDLIYGTLTSQTRFGKTRSQAKQGEEKKVAFELENTPRPSVYQNGVGKATSRISLQHPVQQGPEAAIHTHDQFFCLTSDSGLKEKIKNELEGGIPLSYSNSMHMNLYLFYSC